jgi:hypothetical protein
LNNLKIKNLSTTLALILIATFAVSLIPLPNVAAHSPPWQIPTYAFISVSPNPVGVGQTTTVILWLDITIIGAGVTNDIRFHNYELTITKPDGTTETKTWPIVSDTTSCQSLLYTPTQAGNYTFVFHYPGQTYTWTDPQYTNDTYLASTSRTVTLSVQEDPIPNPINSYPLPTEYWTRPIEGQNTDWWSISSNWLGTGSPPFGSALNTATPNRPYYRVQADGSAPNSAHIMWTKPIQDGGVVGGRSTAGIDGNTYYTGLAYNARFSNPIIMFGRLYYELPFGNSADGGGYTAVDLLTGKQIWYANTTGIGAPWFGYLYTYEVPNQHGTVPSGWLFTTNFARAYDPTTGTVANLNIINVPSGAQALGPAGEHLRYRIDNIGNATNPNWRLVQWNSSKVFVATGMGSGIGASGTIDASLPSRYDFNISIAPLPGLSAPTIIDAVPGDYVFGTSSTFQGVTDSSHLTSSNPMTLWKLNLNVSKGTVGQLLWIKDYSTDNFTLYQGPVDSQNHIFTVFRRQTLQWLGYSIDDGSLLWGPTTDAIEDWDLYECSRSSNIAYGKLYYAGYSGILRCRDITTGSLLWSYGNGGDGNSTDSGLNTAYGHYPTWIGAIADGKVYTLCSEHSPNTPLLKDAKIRCVNATDGTEIWTILGYGTWAANIAMAVADGYLTYFNCYDMKIYCVGKGPSAVTVEAPNTAVSVGESMVIRGSVTDIAAGTSQNEQAARFPNGVPAVSDESMSQWMEYVYMQKPRPINTSGVTVNIDVLDANGNYRSIGTTTSDANGFYSLDWQPDIPGKYTVYVTFAGTDSYYGSYAESAFVVDDASTSTPAPTAEPQQSTADLYFVPAIAGLFIFVAIIGVVIILVLRKRP